MSDLLHRLWQQQVAYNERVREKENPDNFEYWMKQYLLGATSEVNEILQEINWKIHRRGKPLNRHNLARELADLTKFVWSMWEWSGFDAGDMLTFVSEKSDELEVQWQQDWNIQLPQGCAVLITDLDGTVGDWRKAFAAWIETHHRDKLPASYNGGDPSTTMSIEVDLNIPYLVYVGLKEQFEAEGGYSDLPFYPDAVDVLYETTKHPEVQVIAYTARPAKKHGRIWNDTWRWLGKAHLSSIVKELRIGGEERITRACQLMHEDHRVALLEDDPGLALRAANAGIRVFMREQPYNHGVMHPNITRCARFVSRPIFNYLKGEWR